MTVAKSLPPKKLERLIKIDDLIRSRTRHTAGSLAETLEVSERTIRSDIDCLEQYFDAPLQFELKRGYYYTDASWRLPTIPLTQGELFALTLGAKALEAYSGSAYEAELRSSIQRLAGRLPERVWVDLQRLADERIHFRAGAELLNLDPEIYQVLMEAWQSSRQVWIRYYTANRDAETERVVDPYHLNIYRGTNPLLIAFCHYRYKFLDFRLDRIREYRLLDSHFEPDANFNLQEHLNRAFQMEKGDYLYPVAIEFTRKAAPYIRERRWHHSQVIDEHEDGSLTLHMAVGGLQEVKRWVLGYGKEALAKSPPELVILLQQETQVMARQNQTGDFE